VSVSFIPNRKIGLSRKTHSPSKIRQFDKHRQWKQQFDDNRDVLHFRRPRSVPFARIRTPNGSAQSRSINPPRAGKSPSNIMHHRPRGRAHSVACARIKATCKARVYFWGPCSPCGIFANRTRLFSSPRIACRIARTRAGIYIGFSAPVSVVSR